MDACEFTVSQMCGLVLNQVSGYAFDVNERHLAIDGRLQMFQGTPSAANLKFLSHRRKRV